MSIRNDIFNSQKALQESDLWRERLTIDSSQGTCVTIDGKTFLNFSSNDYLGLANHPAVRSAASDAAEKWGVGSGASHLICGHQSPHDQLEQTLTEFLGVEQVVLFSTGYMANLAVPQTFLGRDDLQVQDKLNHASLIDAAMLCRAKLKRYSHCDAQQANEIMANHSDQRMLLATDGVFSMDGTIAPIESLADSANRHDALMLVDDAHGFGVLGDSGRGTIFTGPIRPTNNVIMMGTLSKAIGAFGAFVAGDKILMQQLIQKSRSYIYTTALPSLIAAAATTGVELIRSEPWRREKLLSNIAEFRSKAGSLEVAVLDSVTPIQSIVFGQPAAALRASKILHSQGILAVAIRPPTVPAETSRLRITLSAEHSSEEIQTLAKALAAPEIRELTRSVS